MLAMDRPGSDDLEVPAARDTALAEDGESSPDRGAVLTDARMRQAYALAYRAKVEAVYGGEESEVVRGSADQAATRPNIAEKYSKEYRASDHEPSPIDGPHQPPERWIEDINFDENRKGRNENCGECARAVQSAWQGEPAVAAAIASAWAGGEPPSRMTEWAGRDAKPVSMADISHHLEKLGPGSSAIIGCDWAPPRAGGHWFNAVNDSGMIKAVDGQVAKVEPWPPSMGGLKFDESQMKLSEAIFFTPDGKVARNDHA